MIDSLRTLALLTSCTTARRTALRFVGKALLSEELLLRCTEGKLVAAISTSEGLVLETHRMTSFLIG